MVEQLIELRETLMFTSLLKNVIKDTDEQPHAATYVARSGRVLSTRLSVPLELGHIVPLHRDTFSNFESL